MNVFTNLLFLRDFLAAPHEIDDEGREFAQGYGNRAASAKAFAPLGHGSRAASTQAGPLDPDLTATAACRC